MSLDRLIPSQDSLNGNWSNAVLGRIVSDLPLYNEVTVPAAVWKGTHKAPGSHVNLSVLTEINLK